jgi:FkbM family methyltransferase
MMLLFSMLVGMLGIMSLFFASKVKKGNVFAFEPTDYALKKFHKNLELNPTLAERIEVHQHFIYSSIEDEPKLEAYSSWKLTGSEKKTQCSQRNCKIS